MQYDPSDLKPRERYKVLTLRAAAADRVGDDDRA